MRKLILAWLIVFSMVSSWAQTLPKEPAKQEPAVVKLTVTRKGKMLGPDGKPIDYRLFAFTTKDEAGKQPLQKGKARKRGKVWYISAELLKKNSLDDPKSEQYAKFKEYMAAEKKVAIARNKTNRRRHNKRNDRMPSVASNKTVKGLRSDLQTARAERDSAKAELDKANSDLSESRKENQTLREQNKTLQTQLDEANKKLANAGLAPVGSIATPSPTPKIAVVYTGEPWQPAWWNLYGRVPWWSSWFSSSSGWDWNYTSVFAVWLLIAVILLTIIAIGLARILRPKKVYIPRNRFTLIKGRNWSWANPGNWNWNRTKFWQWPWSRVLFWKKEKPDYSFTSGPDGIANNVVRERPFVSPLDLSNQEPDIVPNCNEVNSAEKLSGNGAIAEPQNGDDRQTEVSARSTQRRVKDKKVQPLKPVVK